MRITTMLAIGASAGLMTAPAAQAALLLQVDLSVPNQITVNATTGTSSATISGSVTTGVYLEGYFVAPGESIVDPNGTGNFTSFLDPTDNTPGIFRGGAGADSGLNFYFWTAGPDANFTSGVQAFTGSGTWNVSPAFYANLLANTGSGNLYFPADDSSDLGGATLIGEWSAAGVSVIPEPSTYIAIVGSIGLGAFLLIRRRKTSVAEETE